MLLFANALVTLLGVIRTPLTAWVLPKEQVGMIGVVVAWLSFLQLLSMPGMDLSAYHYMAKGQRWAFRYAVRYRLRWSLLSSCGFLIGAIYWAGLGQIQLAWLFGITALLYPVAYGLSGVPSMLGAVERFGALLWFRIGDALANYAGLAVVALSPWANWQVVALYSANHLATAALQCGTGAWLSRQLNIGQAAIPTEADKKALVHYGRHMTSISAIATVHGRIDTLLVSMFLPLRTMADYSIAVLVADQVKQLWGVYASVRYPVLVRLPSEQRWRRFALEGSAFLLGFVAASVAIALAAQVLVLLVFPDEYRSSLPLINLVIAAVVCGTPGGISEAYFRTEQNERVQYRMRIFAAVAGALLPSLFLVWWDVYGILFGRILANLLFSGLGVWLFLSFRPK
jgi:O-antigen/teichoic acid export membrane protein